MTEQQRRKKSVADWNARYRVGQLVELRKDGGEIVTTKTRSEAQMLSGHTPVVWLEGVSGCYLLNRATPVSLSKNLNVSWTLVNAGTELEQYNGFMGAVYIGAVTTSPNFAAFMLNFNPEQPLHYLDDYPTLEAAQDAVVESFIESTKTHMNAINEAMAPRKEA